MQNVTQTDATLNDLPAQRAAEGAHVYRQGSHRRRWTDLAFFIWTALLAATPALLRHGVNPNVHNAHYVQVNSHAIIEAFCGVVALLIAGLILTIARHRGDRGIALFGIAFIAMGLLDVLHATTSPTAELGRFVWFHTASVFSGGALIGLAVLGYFWMHPRERPSARSVGVATAIAAAAIPLFLLGGNAPLGAVHETYRFSTFANVAHIGASFLYALAALAIYLHYRVTRQALSLLAAVMMLLFAESAYLFVFSQMWDFTWWLWHWVKSAFYIATLVTVFVGFVTMLRAVQRSHRDLLAANANLAQTRADLVTINAELSARNAMTRRAIHTLQLDKTLKVIADSLRETVGSPQCELILRLPDDEVEEFARLAQRQGFSDIIFAIGTGAPPLCRLDGDMPRDATPDLFLPLYARDEEFGYLHVVLTAEAPAHTRSGQLLLAMAAEAGPIINNALLYHRSAEEIAFRTSLLWISSQLASTLDLTRVLESVCAESALLLHSDGGVIWVNDEAQERAVYSKCVSDNDSHAFIADDRLYGDLLQRMRTDRKPQALLKSEADYVHEQKTATDCVWGSLALFPLLAQDRLLGVMAVVRRERVRFSAAALQKGAVLAEQVRLALNNARQYAALQQTNRQLRELEEGRLKAERFAALGHMAATVAHEVRNPLSAMSNCLAVLRGARVEPQQAQALEIISDEIGRLERLTRNFLTFGRNAGVRNIQAIALAEFVRNAQAQLQRHIAEEEQQVTIESEVRAREPVIYFDADGLWEVVWNLLLNAAQAARGEGKIALRLSATRHYLRIVVSDNGRGIADADREHVFEPFFSSKPQGAGLGLAIVQQFVSQWRGRLRLRSPGRGTQFFIRIPLTHVSHGQREVVAPHLRVQQI